MSVKSLCLSSPQLPVLATQCLLKVTVLFGMEILGILNSIGKVLLGNPVLGMIMRIVVISAVSQLGSPFVMGVLKVVRNITKAPLFNLGKGGIDCGDS